MLVQRWNTVVSYLPGTVRLSICAARSIWLAASRFRLLCCRMPAIVAPRCSFPANRAQAARSCGRCAGGDTARIDERTQIKRVHPVDCERHETRAFLRRARDMEPLDFPKHACRMVDQLGLIRCNLLATQSAQVVACRAERDRADVIRRAASGAGGSSSQVVSACVTFPTISPPKSRGKASRARRACRRAPMPPAIILWPGREVDTGSDIDHSMAHDARAVSTRWGAPSWAILASLFTGVTVPRTFEAPRHRDDLSPCHRRAAPRNGPHRGRPRR